MKILGIDQYPVRWKRALVGVTFLNILLVLQGVIALIWLLLEPSEASNRFFLGYSIERWTLVLLSVGFIVLAWSFLWLIKSKASWVEFIAKKFERKQFSRNFFLGVTGLVLLAFLLFAWGSQYKPIQPYYFRMLPLIILVTVAMTQIFILLLVLSRYTIAKKIREISPFSDKQQIYPISNNLLFFGLICLSIIYLLFQFVAYLNVREAVPLGDTTSFFEGASLKLSDPAFFSERRSWGILLAFKILKTSYKNIEIVQLILSTFSWLTMAWIFTRSLKTQWGKLIGFVLILGFSLSPTVQVWNHAAQSDSFSIIFMILILTILLAQSQEWKWYLFILLILFFSYWMSIHDVNMYIGLVAAAVFFILGIFHKNLRIYWVAALCLVLVFIINSHLSSKYGLPRWALPLAEVITIRILPEQEYLDFFSNQGMPVSPELISFTGKQANANNYSIINSSDLRSFSKWLFSEGKIAYVKFLITHPLYTILKPIENIEVLLATDYFAISEVPKYVPAFPPIINELFYPIRWFYQYIWLTLIGLVFIFVEALRTNSRVFWVGLLFFLVSIPFLYLTWHGDAIAITRHVVIANIQFHLGIWLLLSLYLDKVFAFNQKV